MVNKGGRSDLNPLQVEVSRGQNVGSVPRIADGCEDSIDPPSKRQKTKHWGSPAPSHMSVDEILKNSPTDTISFLPRPSPKEHTVNSMFQDQNVALKEWHNSKLASLSEYRNIERMMDSSGPKKKTRKRTRIGYPPGSFPVPSSQGSSQSSNAASISGSVGNYPAASRSPSLPRPLSNGNRGKSPSPAVHKANTSKPMRNPSVEERSPYFDSQLLPTMPKNGDHQGRESLKKKNCSDSKRSPKLANRFISVDGSRRCSDVNLSSEADELQQLGTTIGQPKEQHTSKSRQHSPNKTLAQPPPSTVENDSGPEEWDQDDSSAIKPTQFTSLKKADPGEAPRSKDRRRETKAPWSVILAAASFSGKIVSSDAMALVYDESNATYNVVRNGIRQRMKVQPQKVLKVIWSTDSRKIRFMSSKSGTEDNIVDLILTSELDVTKLIQRLGRQYQFKTESVSE